VRSDSTAPLEGLEDMFFVRRQHSSYCVQGPNGGPRGTALQQLNHFVQRHGLHLEWVDWQDPELMWSSQLSVDGRLATTASGFARKQAAREHAAQSFLGIALQPRGQA
jgi:hypothetical protein